MDKSKKYYMDVLCGVEHLQNIVNERVPMGERGEVLEEIMKQLLFGGKEVVIPRLQKIEFTWKGMVE